MIREAVVDEIAAAKARGEQRPRKPPVVGAATLRLVDRTGRGEHARRLTPPRRSKAAEGAIVFLELVQRRLARHRQLRERGARRDRSGIDRGQDARECRGVGLRVRDLPRQLREELALANLRIADFEQIEVLAHRHRLAARRAPRRRSTPALLGELREDERVRSRDELARHGVRQRLRILDEHPVRAREIGRRNDPVLIGQLEKALRGRT
jgi:hypothetical protein